MTWALVTGGNRGLGFACCKQLVSQGKPVILTARSVADGTKAAEDLKAANQGAKVEVLELDVADAACIRKLGETVGERFKSSIDLVVANSGVFKKEWTEEGYRASLAVNFDGTVDTVLALAPHLAPGALVIVVASTLGQLSKLTPDYAGPISQAATLQELRSAVSRFDASSPMPRHNTYSPDYSVSKAAVNRAVQLLSQEGSPLRLAGAAIASTCPGWCRTRMGSDAATRSPEQGAASILAPYDRALKGEALSVNCTFTSDGAVQEW